MEIDVNRDEIGMNCSSAPSEEALQGRSPCAVQIAHSAQGCEDRGLASTLLSVNRNLWQKLLRVRGRGNDGGDGECGRWNVRQLINRAVASASWRPKCVKLSRCCSLVILPS